MPRETPRLRSSPARSTSKGLASAVRSWPTNAQLGTVHLDRLAHPPRSLAPAVLMRTPQARRACWARAFARQCQDALDELTFLDAVDLLPDPPDKESGDFA
jgi:hypothetical protein